jgi:hypothetical protein
MQHHQHGMMFDAAMMSIRMTGHNARTLTKQSYRVTGYSYWLCTVPEDW